MLNLFEKMYQGAGRVAMLANSLGTAVVLALVAIVVYDVIAREVFHMPLAGAVEVVQFALTLVVFLQLPDVMRVNRLTRSDGFLILTQSRFPRANRWARRIIDVVSSLFMLAIAVAVLPDLAETWEAGDYLGIPGIFTVPVWPMKLAIVVGSGLSTLILFFKAILPAVDTGSTHESF